MSLVSNHHFPRHSHEQFGIGIIDFGAHRSWSGIGMVTASAGDKLRFVTEQRVWKVDNPEILEGHEGHYLHAKAYAYPDKNLIHITEVKIPTARETRLAVIK